MGNKLEMQIPWLQLRHSNSVGLGGAQESEFFTSTSQVIPAKVIEKLLEINTYIRTYIHTKQTKRTFYKIRRVKSLAWF